MEMITTIQKGKTVSSRVLKRRARKGIPDSMRGSVWPILAEGQKQIPKEFDGVVSDWIKYLLEQQLNPKDMLCIYKDIPRTLPDHAFFEQKDGTG